jgi:hypothetical protein
MSKSIIDIYARRGKMGEVERFDFSGAEAKKEIDQYIDTIKATKADLDADKAASAEYADRTEKAASSVEQSASSAAKNASDAISAAKNAKKSAEDAAKVKTSVDIFAGDATTAAAAAKAWAVGPSGASEGGTDTNNAKYWAEIAKDNASHAGVNSWNGRSGAVAPQEGDYTAEMVGALPSEGTAVAADKLSSVRRITANLENEGGSSFDGTRDVSVGVIGTLPVTHGGTGGTTAAAARKALGVPSMDTASTSENGLMSSTDKNKLNGVDEGANNTVVDDELSSFSTNPVQNKVVNKAIVEINEKLNGIEEGANKTIVDEALSATSTNPVQNKTVNSIITDLTGQITGVKDSCSSMWTASQAYVAGQYAIYNNYIYRCIKDASAGTVPTNTTYWVKTDLASEITLLNSNLAKRFSYTVTNAGVTVPNNVHVNAIVVGHYTNDRYLLDVTVQGLILKNGTGESFDLLSISALLSTIKSALGKNNTYISTGDAAVPLANNGAFLDNGFGPAAIINNFTVGFGRFYNESLSFGRLPMRDMKQNGTYSFGFYAEIY